MMTCGLESMLDEEGTLRIFATYGEWTDPKPAVFQEVAGVRIPVDCRFVLETGDDGHQTVSFEFPESYDKS